MLIETFNMQILMWAELNFHTPRNLLSESCCRKLGTKYEYFSQSQFVRTNNLKPFRFQGNVAYSPHPHLFPPECTTGPVKEETFHHSECVWKHQSTLIIWEEETERLSCSLRTLLSKNSLKGNRTKWRLKEIPTE